MKIRLTESDLKSIIREAVDIILNENIDTEILSKIVERLSTMDITVKKGSNDVEVDFEDGSMAFIEYEMEDSRYLTPSNHAFDRYYPDDGDVINGDFEIYVQHIYLSDPDGNEREINDENDMVANALKSVVNADEIELDYYEYDQPSYNDL